MNKHYILKDKKAVECIDLIEWDQNFELASRIVGKDFFGKVEVSTVFLGLDYSFHHEVPLLFETMVFGGKLDREQRRYTTWEEAELGHKEILEKVIETENE